MDAAKIRLSKEEMELVLRSDWILTKNSVQQKAWYFLESLQSIQQPLMNRLPAEVSSINPKISKGEKYQGLPYLILDQPRYFIKNDVFAIRTMFWWGNFFSSTLHLAGMYKERYEQKIMDAIPSLSTDLFICINEDPWEHHFEDDNYVPVNSISPMNIKTIIKTTSFIKLSRKVSLQDWENAKEILLQQFGEYINLSGE